MQPIFSFSKFMACFFLLGPALWGPFSWPNRPLLLLFFFFTLLLFLLPWSNAAGLLLLAPLGNWPPYCAIASLQQLPDRALLFFTPLPPCTIFWSLPDSRLSPLVEKNLEPEQMCRRLPRRSYRRLPLPSYLPAFSLAPHSLQVNKYSEPTRRLPYSSYTPSLSPPSCANHLRPLQKSTNSLLQPLTKHQDRLSHNHGEIPIFSNYSKQLSPPPPTLDLHFHPAILQLTCRWASTTDFEHFHLSRFPSPSPSRTSIELRPLWLCVLITAARFNVLPLLFQLNRYTKTRTFDPPSPLSSLPLPLFFLPGPSSTLCSAALATVT
jgi:hypothetical protein